MKRMHVALAVSDLTKAIADYEERMGHAPCVVVPETYALFRNSYVNLSLTQASAQAGMLRHLGIEDDTAPTFSAEADIDGIVWERFSARQQADEIKKYWPQVVYDPGE
ncbi:MAG: hypothetical protein OXU81_13055 [Gammaproteobacteria bacterium]|nr:hypothetical protein [Gammaproteobacteria bacterium]